MNLYESLSRKDKYINKIFALFALSDKYGTLLIELMDRHNANNLRELTEEQVINIYEELKERRVGR